MSAETLSALEAALTRLHKAIGEADDREAPWPTRRPWVYRLRQEADRAKEAARAHLASERSEAVEALERVRAWCREQYVIEPDPADPHDKVTGAYGSVAGFISHMPEMRATPPTETGT